MGKGDRGLILHDLERLLHRGVAPSADGELLERFRSTGDEAAFEALVARHGPMVRGVCRRLLRDDHDADDAFQATFLVLARKGGGLRDPDRLGPWLFGVASRVAAKARARNARKRGRPLTDDLPAREDPRAEWSDVRPILDAELARLPAPQRDVLVLCLLGGASEQEASRRLDCPVGTVKSRLSRAREALRGRLVKRGVAPATALAAASSVESFASPVSSTLLRATVATIAAQAPIPPAVALLAQGVAPTMLLRTTFVKLALAGGLAALGLTAAATSQLAPTGGPAPAAKATPPPRVGDWNLKSVLLALRNYHEATGAFPTAAIRGADGRPNLSWRVAILPYLDAKALYEEFHLDESWDSPHNKALIPRMPAAFRTPDFPAPEGTTRFRGLTGGNTMFDPALDPATGRTLDRGVSFREVLDGLTNTVLVAVAEDPVDWTRPGEIDLAGLKAEVPLVDRDPAGYELGMADGTVRRLPKAPGRDLRLRQAATRAGMEPLSWEDEAAGSKPAQASAPSASDTAARRERNLQQMLLALHNYYSTNGSMPTAATHGADGKPLLSWRVAILPYLEVEGPALYNEFHLDEPWDSPHNRALIPRMPKDFETPGLETPPGQTRIRGYSGPDTMLGPELGAATPPGVRFDQVTDGAGATAFLTIAAEPTDWTRPGELPVGPGRSFARPDASDPRGYVFAMADGSIRRFPAVPGRDAFVLAALSRSGGEVIPWEVAAPVEPRPAAEAASRPNPTAPIAAPPASMPVRPANLDATSNNLGKILMALHNYQSAKGTLPAAATYSADGRPLLSWRVAILPYFSYASPEEHALYGEFRQDQPWDSPHNKPLIARMPAVFQTPGLPAPAGETRIRGVEAPGSIFGSRVNAPAGGKIAFEDVTDGTSVTAALVVAQEAVPWTKPGEMTKLLREVGSIQDGKTTIHTADVWPLMDDGADGYILGMVDGTVRRIPSSLQHTLLPGLFTYAGGEVINLSVLADPSPAPAAPPSEARDSADADRRLRRVEEKLDAILKRLDAAKP